MPQSGELHCKLLLVSSISRSVYSGACSDWLTSLNANPEYIVISGDCFLFAQTVANLGWGLDMHVALCKGETKCRFDSKQDTVFV